MHFQINDVYLQHKKLEKCKILAQNILEKCKL